MKKTVFLIFVLLQAFLQQIQKQIQVAQYFAREIIKDYEDKQFTVLPEIDETKIYVRSQCDSENTQFLSKGQQVFLLDQIQRLKAFHKIDMNVRPTSCYAEFKLYIYKNSYNDEIKYYISDSTSNDDKTIYTFNCKTSTSLGEINESQCYLDRLKDTKQSVISINVKTSPFYPESNSFDLGFIADIDSETTTWGINNYNIFCNIIECPENSTLQEDSITCLCDPGFYKKESNPIVCKPKAICHSSCLQCLGNSNICEICPINAKFIDGNAQCQCPNNSYLSEDGQKCLCSDFAFMNNEKCECIQGFYLVQEEPLICKPIVKCHFSCLQCKQYTNECIKCPKLSINDKYMCQCPQGTILNEETQECVCPNANSNFDSDQNMCICKAGYFVESIYPTLQCQKIEQCDPQCLQCEKNTNKCISCPQNSINDGTKCQCRNNQVLYNNQLCDCPATTVLNQITQKCECINYNEYFEAQTTPFLRCELIPLCSQTCRECEKNSNICKVCPLNAKLSDDKTYCICPIWATFSASFVSCICPENSSMKNGQCICNKDFYISSTFPELVCQKIPTCHQSCVQCYLNSEKCYKCPKNSVLSNDGKQCICPKYSIKSDKDQCSCPANSYLSSDLSKCICNQGYYLSQEQPPFCSLSTPCHKSCLECQEISGICNKCPNNAYKNIDNRSCACPLFSFISDDNQECICPVNSTPEISNGIYSKCQCDYGYYSSLLDIQQNLLICDKIPKCDDTCLKCNFGTTQCVQCPTQGIMDDDEKRCSCPKFAVLSLDKQICQCVNNTTLNSQGQECECQKGFYPVNYDPLYCSEIRECHPSCSQCEPNTGICLKCKYSNTYISLNNLMCESPMFSSFDSQQNDYTCPQNSSPQKIESINICKCNIGFQDQIVFNKLTCYQILLCDNSCLDCDHKKGICKKCPENGFFTDDKKGCNCPQYSTLINNQICACPNNAVILRNKKVCVCDEKYYVKNQDPLVCALILDCSQTCSKCNKYTDICTSCPENGIMAYDQKSCVCPEGASFEYFFQQCLCPIYSSLSEDGKYCKCDEGFYAQTIIPLICEEIPICDETCIQCQNFSDICILCPPGSVYSEDFKQCVCPGNQYIPGYGQNCQCGPNTNLMDDGVTCQCNEGYYVKNQYPLVCELILKCSDNCICQEYSNKCIRCKYMNAIMSNDRSDCYCPINSKIVDNKCQCFNGLSFSNNGYSCVCQQNEYSLKEGGCQTIVQCDQSCLQCDYPLSEKCLKCPEFSILQKDQKKCKCPDKMILSVDKQSCLCPQNSTFINNTCKCNDGYYEDQNKCILIKSCNVTCLECKKYTDQCIKCPTNGILSIDSKTCVCPQNSSTFEKRDQCSCYKNFQYNPISQACECKQGYYLNIVTKTYQCQPIQKCNSSCLQCKLNDDECIKCPLNGFITADKKSCKCPDQATLDKSQTICVCPLNSVPIDNVCQCLQGYFENKKKPLQCLLIPPCNPNCIQCHEGTSKCKVYPTYSILLDDENVICPQYSKLDMNENICQCKENMKMYDNNKSSCQCVEDYYFDENNQLCMPKLYCDQSCLNCDVTKRICNKCPINASLSQDQSSCICNQQGYQFSIESLECVQTIVCDASCLQCLDKSEQCIRCPTLGIMDKSKKKCQCPANSVLSDDKLSCICNKNYYISKDSQCLSASNLKEQGKDEQKQP